MLIRYSLCKDKSLFHFIILVKVATLLLTITLITRYFPFVFCLVFNFSTNVMDIISATDFPLFCSNFVRKCLRFAGRMLAPKIAYSARNSAGRIYPSLVLTGRVWQTWQFPGHLRHGYSVSRLRSVLFEIEILLFLNRNKNRQFQELQLKNNYSQIWLDGRKIYNQNYFLESHFRAFTPRVFLAV